MAGHGIHVHGPHEHEVEHRAHQGHSLSQYVAIFTAILSTFAAVISYHGSAIQTEALQLKNDAVIKQNQATDQWSFYQAKSGKQHLMELSSELVPERTQHYRVEMQRYTNEKLKIRQQAEALEAASEQDNLKSEKLLANHHKEAEGMMLLQIAISLASITALTRKRWLFSLAGIAALIGIIISIIAWF